MDSYSTLPWVTCEVVTVVKGTPWWGLLWHMLANGVLVYPSQGEGTMLKAARHWGRDCSVINDTLGEPGCTPLYIGLHPCEAPWTETKCFPHFSWEGPLLGTLTDINEGTNHWLWRWSFSLHRDPVGEHGGGAHLPGTLTERCRRKLWRWVSLCRGPLGNLGSLLTGNFKRHVECSGKGISLLAGALFRGLLPGDLEGHGDKGSGDGHHSPWGPRWGI